MTKQRYRWNRTSPPPGLGHHSTCKHGILRDYLYRYLTVLHSGTLRYGKPLNVTIIDGCAGGGKYQYNGQDVDGSPFIILDTIQEVATAIQTRNLNNGSSNMSLNADVIFVEKDKEAGDFLENEVQSNQEKYSASKVKFFHGDFNKKLPAIIDFVTKKSRGRPGHCLFFLDQYGYTEIELVQVREIFQKLKKAEVILTFAIDYLVDYLSDSKRDTLKNMGFRGSSIDQLLRLSKDTKENRATIEFILARHIHSFTAAKFYTPFFIRGDATHRGYWLVHLSNHYRARDEMMNTHWKMGNDLVHYGSAGIDMLGYRSKRDENYTRQPYLTDDFKFDKDAKGKIITVLPEELTKYIYEKNEIFFRDLMSDVFNHTPAKREFIVDALEECFLDKQFTTKRRTMKNIKDTDLITASRQRIFVFNKTK